MASMKLVADMPLRQLGLTVTINPNFVCSNNALFAAGFTLAISCVNDYKISKVSEKFTSMLDLLAVGPKFTRPACHMQPTMRIARRCTTLLLLRALSVGQTDGRTDGHGNVLVRSPHIRSA